MMRSCAALLSLFLTAGLAAAAAAETPEVASPGECAEPVAGADAGSLGASAVVPPARPASLFDPRGDGVGIDQRFGVEPTVAGTGPGSNPGAGPTGSDGGVVGDVGGDVGGGLLPGVDAGPPLASPLVEPVLGITETLLGGNE